jgi:hypothetical protein
VGPRDAPEIGTDATAHAVDGVTPTAALLAEDPRARQRILGWADERLGERGLGTE